MIQVSAVLLGLLGEVIDDHVERLAAADPALKLTTEQGADLLEGLDALRIVLAGEGQVHFPQGILAGRRHAP